MVLPLLLLEAMLLTSVSDASTSVIRIYVDPDNGTMDPKCWTEGLNLPMVWLGGRENKVPNKVV